MSSLLSNPQLALGWSKPVQLALTYPESRTVRREGLSSFTAAAERLYNPSENELKTLGFKSPGYLIPYFDYDRNPILDAGKFASGEPNYSKSIGRPFYRQRLKIVINKKYDQVRDSNQHIYIPNRLPDLDASDGLILVEGEHKASSLCEEGIPAIGIGGIWNFQRDHVLCPELVEVIIRARPKRLYFLGDNDTCHVPDFAACALRMATLTNMEVWLPRIPMSCPKGIDDVRAAMGTEFLSFWNNILKTSIPVTPATDKADLSIALLKPETASITQIMGDERRKIFRHLATMGSRSHFDRLQRIFESLITECGFSSASYRNAVAEIKATNKANRGLPREKQQKPNIDQFYCETTFMPAAGLPSAPRINRLNIENSMMLVNDETCIDPPELVTGLIHMGTKSVIAAGSKVGKTWLLMDLALSVATGSDFWGFSTLKSKVLYINMELLRCFSKKRLKKVSVERKISDHSNLDICNLRAEVTDLSVILPDILESVRSAGYSLIILDPIYKLMGGRDENHAGAMAEICEMMESIVTASNAAVVYAHHFGKGSQKGKNHIDCLNGSGVLARDADSLITLREVAPKSYLVEMTLRNMAAPETFYVDWEFPVMKRSKNPVIPYPALKTVTVSSKENRKKAMLDLLTTPMSITAWQEAAENHHGIKRRSFFSYKSELLNEGLITASTPSSAKGDIMCERKAA